MNLPLASHWSQHATVLAARPRGLHLITAEVMQAAPPIATLACGLLHVFIQHTSASLTINENADPDVRHDLNRALDELAPEAGPYTHVCEGPDDMPAHIKCSLMGASLSVPIHEGRLALGTWQGIYLCEHRDHGGPRRLLLT
ncbi:MAG: secondary thiamine-phosphate synthase enzyme YjbQ, partial [Pseudomonadota bacterium]